MSIELSGSTSSAKIMAGADKGKAKPKDDGATSDEGGFSSILTSLDSSVDEVDDANKPLKLKNKLNHAGSISSDVLPDPKSSMLATAALLQEPTPASRVMSDSITPAVSDSYSEMAMLLAQADKIPNNSVSPASDGVPVGPRSARVTLPGVGAEKPDVSIRTLLSLGAEKAGDLKQNNVFLQDETSSVLLGQARNARVTELQSAAAASLVESRVNTQTFMADDMMRESAFSAALLSSGLGDEVLRQKDDMEGALRPKTEGSGVESIWGQQAFHAGTSVDTPQLIADTPMISPEKTVADTVSYWVTQGVQNAELTLDGFGGESIGVSISLKGDEARIDFRTDQAEVRQVLEGAVAHLKDLLSSEGLVLSGVSVGGSGQEGAGAQERRNQPGVRQATFVTKDAGVTENTPRVNKPVGRGLDIYV